MSAVEVQESIQIPAREGRGVQLKAGQRFRCIDVEGKQCGDLFAFCSDNVREYHSAEHTRVWNDNLFPRVGEQFVTNRRRPILTFLADDTPGRHDMLIAACDPTRFELLGCEGWHASCQENLQKVMAGFGHEDIEIPQPINVFTNLPVGADGSLSWEPALTKAGAVVLGVSKDSIASHCKFRDKFKLNFALLSDPDGKVLEAYGAWGDKVMYGKKMKGIIRSTVLIDKDGKVVKHWPKVSVKGHAEEVIETVKALA